MTTRDRILDTALVAFGSRGYEATSLDALAVELGVRKQTILYWFASKEALLDAVVERAGIELAGVLEAALASAKGVDRIEAVLKSVFGYSVRRPELLGLLREVNRMGGEVSIELSHRLAPLIERAVASLGALMDAGIIRRAHPRTTLALLYTLAVGVAADVEAHRGLGVGVDVAGLRRLRRELFGFVRAALSPS